MIGSTVEGHMGSNNPNFSEGKTKTPHELKMLQDFIQKDLQKNENNITDTFINCK